MHVVALYSWCGIKAGSVVIGFSTAPSHVFLELHLNNCVLHQIPNRTTNISIEYFNSAINVIFMYIELLSDLFVH